MGKWKRNQEEKRQIQCTRNGKYIYVGHAITQGDASLIAGAHNADCDRYEARIADLTAELDRVKAESLRVVECGEVCELQDCMVEYCFIEGKDRLNFASEFAKQHYPTMRVQPVRLERWGNEGEIVRWPSGAIFTADDAHHGLTGE